MNEQVEILLRREVAVNPGFGNIYAIQGLSDNNYKEIGMPSFLGTSLREFEEDNNVILFYRFDEIKDSIKEKYEDKKYILSLNDDNTYEIVKAAPIKQKVKSLKKF
jgi:hypothetical protein